MFHFKYNFFVLFSHCASLLSCMYFYDLRALRPARWYDRDKKRRRNEAKWANTKTTKTTKMTKTHETKIRIRLFGRFNASELKTLPLVARRWRRLRQNAATTATAPSAAQPTSPIYQYTYMCVCAFVRLCVCLIHIFFFSLCFALEH